MSRRNVVKRAKIARGRRLALLAWARRPNGLFVRLTEEQRRRLRDCYQEDYPGADGA